MMVLSPLQQAVGLIQKSKNILIALPENLSGDSLGSALALGDVLKKLGKKTEIVTAAAIPEKLKFLSGWENVRETVSVWRDFIISIDTSEHKISRLRYEREKSLLKIFLTTPEKIEQKDIKLEPGAFNYDLVITLAVPDLESLGAIFEKNTELFFSKPILNIDHQAANENFGAVNLVEPTAAADAEIAARLIEVLGADLIDEAGATALLTGLVSKTRSFQNVKTTPQALNLASLLIAKGAEQEKIIQQLYKTKPLSRLKLWGRLLSQMDYDPGRQTVWFWATPEDFAATQTNAQELPFILEEIEDFFPQTNLSFILWTDENGFLWALAGAKQPTDLQKINLEIGGTLKNEKLLLHLTETDLAAAKNRLNILIDTLK